MSTCFVITLSIDVLIEEKFLFKMAFFKNESINFSFLMFCSYQQKCIYFFFNVNIVAFCYSKLTCKQRYMLHKVKNRKIQFKVCDME